MASPVEEGALMAKTCVICSDMAGTCLVTGDFCMTCRKAYDVFAAKEGTVTELIRWVAERVRKFERKRTTLAVRMDRAGILGGVHNLKPKRKK